MTISLLLDRSIPVLILEGRLDARGASELDEKLLEVAAPHVVLDMTAVAYLSSMGVRSLIVAEKTLRRNNGTLLLAGIPPLVARVLELAGLLGEFQRFSEKTAAVAAAIAARDARAGATEHTIADRVYRLAPAAAEPCAFEIWGPSTEDPFAALAASGPPVDATLEELGVAFGMGGLGAARSQDTGSLGAFLAVGNVAAVLPAGGRESDFLVSERPNEAGVCVTGAVGFSGPPTRAIEWTASTSVTLRQVIDDLAAILGPQPLIGFVMRTKVQGALATIAGIYSPESGLRAHGLLYEGALKLEDLRAVVRALPDTVVRGGSISVYVPAAVRLGPEKRVRIEVAGEVAMEAEWLQIIRRLYSDCSRVFLTQLTGGYMAKTFQVASYDQDGRRLLPTVLKIATRELIRREEDAHRACVQRFILNNSTTIMGTASEGAWSALRYNFLGVSGAESKLGWLLDYYTTRPAADVVAIFDRLYTRILKPWYGQPRWEPVRLYQDHTPLKLFPNVCAEAERQFGISPDQETIDCPELGVTLPNPFRFLQYEYPKRAAQARLWYQGINHGDLNLRNVLVDELENLYVIDFSETRVRNIVSDFARMETVLKFQIVPLETPEDLARMVEFEQGLEETESLEETPPNRYRGQRAAEVGKAYAVICRLRRHAKTVTLFETDILPYWLAALEWTYSVVCYDEPLLRKKLATYSAALVCKRILESEGRAVGA
jgi:anti-anti-sigma factor